MTEREDDLDRRVILGPITFFLLIAARFKMCESDKCRVHSRFIPTAVEDKNRVEEKIVCLERTIPILYT